MQVVPRVSVGLNLEFIDRRSGCNVPAGLGSDLDPDGGYRQIVYGNVIGMVT